MHYKGFQIWTSNRNATKSWGAFFAPEGNRDARRIRTCWGKNEQDAIEKAKKRINSMTKKAGSAQ